MYLMSDVYWSVSWQMYVTIVLYPKQCETVCPKYARFYVFSDDIKFDAQISAEVSSREGERRSQASLLDVQELRIQRNGIHRSYGLSKREGELSHVSVYFHTCA